MSVVVHRARLVLSPGAPALADGAVAVRDGRLAAVGCFDEVVREFDAPEVHEWNGAEATDAAGESAAFDAGTD